MLMKFVENIPAALVFLGSMGYAFDKLILKKTKLSMYNRLVTIWNWLDDLKVHNYAKAVSKVLLNWALFQPI